MKSDKHHLHSQELREPRHCVDRSGLERATSEQVIKSPRPGARPPRRSRRAASISSECPSRQMAGRGTPWSSIRKPPRHTSPPRKPWLRRGIRRQATSHKREERVGTTNSHHAAGKHFGNRMPSSYRPGGGHCPSRTILPSNRPGGKQYETANAGSTRAKQQGRHPRPETLPKECDTERPPPKE